MSEQSDELANQPLHTRLSQITPQQVADLQRRAEKAERALAVVRSQLEALVGAHDALAETVRRLKEEKRLVVDGMRAVCADMMAKADLARAYQLQIDLKMIRDWAVYLEEAIGNAEPADN